MPELEPQVNATDLRKMRYPLWDQLLRLGSHVKHRMPDLETIDKILEKECPSHRRTMMKYLDDISWETEVWIADSPTHLIHFNGERFLGPHEE